MEWSLAVASARSPKGCPQWPGIQSKVTLTPRARRVWRARDSAGFDTVHVSARGAGGADVDGVLAVREDRVAGSMGLLAWEGGDFADAVGEPLCSGVGGVVVSWEVLGVFEYHPGCCGDGGNLSTDVCDQDAGLGPVGLDWRDPICGADYPHSSPSLGGGEGAGGTVRDDDCVSL